MIEQTHGTSDGRPGSTRIELSLAWRGAPPLPAGPALAVERGGPEALLRWLETQLGLGRREAPRFERVAAYARALAEVPEAIFAASLGTDEWATASALLERRDELRLAGWDGSDRDGLPRLVRDMARAETLARDLAPGEAERLAAVGTAIDRGQRLPPHSCVLHEVPAAWPPVWRATLEQLEWTSASPPQPRAAPGTVLAAVQEGLLGTLPAGATADPSLRWVRSRSVAAACELVAAALAARGGPLDQVLVCCEDEQAASALDHSLARAGLPTMGATTRSAAHPAQQALPIALRLCFAPVDPALLLDFLTLPRGPFGRAAASQLTAALCEQPGLGSRSWLAAVEQLRQSAGVSDGADLEILAAWLDVERRPWGTALTPELVASRCALVERWAAARARAAEDDGSSDLAAALSAAARQAMALGRLVGGRGREVSEVQLLRMLEAVMAGGWAAAAFAELDGAPRLVQGLHQVAAPCAGLVWLGVDSTTRWTSRWSLRDLAALGDLGIEVDDGSRTVAAVRAMERRGLAQVEGSLLALEIPSAEEAAPQPLWLQAKGALAAGGLREPLSLEEVVTRREVEALAPWNARCAARAVSEPPPRRLLWTAAPGLLRPRATTSASELEIRLACPLRWVLHYAARIWPGPLARLPGERALKGTFCHAVLAEVLGADGAPTDPNRVAAEVVRVFEQRVGLDAAPLAQPQCRVERARLKARLAAAARLLATVLRDGGYRVVGTEVATTGELDGRALDGAMDCLVRRPDGAEAVIDFKVANSNDKFRKLLAKGRATQLATYAYARACATGAFPAVGYLILSDGVLFTPSGSALHGRRATGFMEVEGDAIAEVWERFVAAVRAADGWLGGGEPVPVRPLQPAAERPAGVALVLERKEPQPLGNLEPPCSWCDYPVLCGARRLE